VYRPSYTFHSIPNAGSCLSANAYTCFDVRLVADGRLVWPAAFWGPSSPVLLTECANGSFAGMLCELALRFRYGCWSTEFKQARRLLIYIYR
jgi:hypothetical protein